MDRKVYVNVTTKLIFRVDEGQSIYEVLENMDYSFTSDSENAEILETEILDWEIVAIANETHNKGYNHERAFNNKNIDQ